VRSVELKSRPLLAGITIVLLLSGSVAFAADKVVVIPLMSSKASGGKFVDGDDPADAVYTGGNVGIGTATPQAVLLHVDGTPGVDGIMYPDGTLQTSATVQGPKGDTGAAGPQGAQGIKGDTGDPGATGSQGAQGVKGDTGDTGATGAQGAQGVKGDTGDTGATGAQGAQGIKGDTGDPGATGSQGAQGVKGDTGVAGPQGSQGIKGDTGDTGSTGAQGAQGIKGDTGDTGATGAQGPQGVKGDTGDPGATGSQGAQGVKGDTGDTGATGAQGAQGIKGDTGDPGATGAQGAQGEKGDTGVAGSQGAQGVKGDTGDTGATGAQGAQGIKGDTGDPGATGAQGPQGVKGDTGDTGDPGATGTQGPQGDTGTSLWEDGIDKVTASVSVGIGSADPSAMLDVAGGMKIADDTSSCDTSKAGLIRWTGSEFEGCNGVAWIFLFGVPTVNSLGIEWMDRNLGASRVAQSPTDANAYGDLYQWGRPTDGHEKRSSGVTPSPASSDVPGHGEFISSGSPPNDWRVPQNDTLWQQSTGTNNPCPAGFRLPSKTELDNEKQSWGSQNTAGAFASPLRLVMAGTRHFQDGTIQLVGSYGFYWSATVGGSTGSWYLLFSNGSVGNVIDVRAFGLSVRCLKD